MFCSIFTCGSVWIEPRAIILANKRVSLCATALLIQITLLINMHIKGCFSVVGHVWLGDNILIPTNSGFRKCAALLYFSAHISLTDTYFYTCTLTYQTWLLQAIEGFTTVSTSLVPLTLSVLTDVKMCAMSLTCSRQFSCTRSSKVAINSGIATWRA